MAVATNPIRPAGSRNPFAGLFSGRSQRQVLAVVLFAAAVYPLFSRGLINNIDFLPWPSMNNLIVMCYYAILALGLNIVVGFAGLLDLGYVAFFVVGAYTTAFLASPQFGIHLSWWLVAIVAVGAAGLSGILLGAPTLKLRGDYLAIVTLGFGEIMPLLAKNLDAVTIKIGDTFLLNDVNLTGGALGINPIDPPSIPIGGSWAPWGEEMIFSNRSPELAFYLVLGLLILSFAVCVRLRDSRLGRAWMAVREDETAAASMGINTVSTKLLAFSLGASASGFVGAFVGAYQTAIFPESFAFSVSISILIMIILGGMGSLRGVVVGAFIIQYVNQSLLPFLGELIDNPIRSLGAEIGVSFVKNFTLTSFNFLIYGVILVVMMIYRPEGLLPADARKAELHGEGISADQTFATDTELAEAVARYEEAHPEMAVTQDDAPPEASDDRTGDDAWPRP